MLKIEISNFITKSLFHEIERMKIADGFENVCGFRSFKQRARITSVKIFRLKNPNVVKSVVRHYKETFIELDDFKVWESQETIYSEVKILKYSESSNTVACALSYVNEETRKICKA